MSRKPDPRRDVLVACNPATTETIAELPMASPEQVRAAVAKAAEAFPAWSALPLCERAGFLLRARDWLLDHVDEVCDTISTENGKPRPEALTAEVFLIADLITYYCGRAAKVFADRPIPLHNPLMFATKTSRIRYEPLGVVSVVSPWNYPFGIPASGIVFALLAGNTVVFKPASDTALIGLKIDEMLRRGGGLPEGVLNTVIAGGAAMGNALFEPPVRKIVFTGSTDVGAKIQAIAARHLIPTVMELGGKDPMVVCEDADLDLAASGAVWGAFMNCGQTCCSVERVYVARPVYARFTALVAEKTRALRVGDARDDDVDVGPMTNLEQLGIVEDQVRDALAKGARVLAGGARLTERPGYFFPPTVLADADHSMTAMTEETFGPLLPLMPFDTEDEAVALANDSIYGLTASVWTRDREAGRALAGRIQAGTVTINDHGHTYGLCETPWHGMKESGIGVSHSDAGLLEFVFPKHVHEDRSPSVIRRRMWWYPYSRAGYEFQKLAVRAFATAKAMPRLVYALATKGEFRKVLF